MYRFKDILFTPLGRSDNPAAVRRIADLAERNDAKLTLLGVIPEASRLQHMLHRSELHDAVQHAQRQALRGKLNRWAAKNDRARTETLVEVGNPALAVVRRVLAGDHDLVVVTSDEDREDHATIKRILRKCPCPVWVIRKTRARTQRVLAAVNPEPDEAELNRTILELASTMAELYGGELHVVHAWELYGESAMRSSAFIHTQAAEMDLLLGEQSVTHQNALADLLASSGVADAQWQVHVHKGSPPDVVSGVVAKHKINLLIMGTLARTGVTGLVMGNTAEQVLDDVSCSVIAVKPPGFVSPLAPRPM